MEGTETSATAVLVDRQDAGGRPTTTTLLVAREELEEALASDDAPELLLEVQLGSARLGVPGVAEVDGEEVGPPGHGRSPTVPIT